MSLAGGPPIAADFADAATGKISEVWRIFLRDLGSAIVDRAPIDGTYWTSRATASLTAEQNLGALASGYLRLAVAIGTATPSTVTTIPPADITGLLAALALLRPLAPRVTSLATHATPTPDADTTDLYALTAQATAAAFANPTGTPGNGQTLRIRIKDDGTARGLTWGTAYVAGGTALPATTVLSKILNLWFQYDTDNALNRWQLLHAAQEV
jgi:hypothetical protein